MIDLCCGVGLHSAAAAAIGYRVTGIDLSGKSVEAARAYAESRGLQEKCTFRQGDAIEELLRQPSCDVLFCAGSLYYLDLETAIAAIKKAIDDGYFVGIEVNGSNPLMHAVRRTRHWFRPYLDERTLTGLLRLEDLERLSEAFDFAELHYFDFFTLAGGALSKLPRLGRFYHRIALRLDDFILNRLGFRRLAFKVAFCVSQSSSAHEM